MDDFYCSTSNGQREDSNDATSLRTNVFYPTIDRMLGEINARFSPQSELVMNGIHACNPSSETFMDMEHLRRFCLHYDIPFSEPEALVIKNFIPALQLKYDRPMTMEKAYELIDGNAFPTVKKIMQAALTVPVTSCTCERSFSCLRRVRTWLRTTMTQERLDHCSVLALEKETYIDCTDDELVAAFHDKKEEHKYVIYTD